MPFLPPESLGKMPTWKKTLLEAEKLILWEVGMLLLVSSTFLLSRPVVLNVGSMAAHKEVIKLFYNLPYIFEYLFWIVQTLNWVKIDLFGCFLILLLILIIFMIFLSKIIIFSKIKKPLQPTKRAPWSTGWETLVKNDKWFFGWPPCHLVTQSRGPLECHVLFEWPLVKKLKFLPTEVQF